MRIIRYEDVRGNVGYAEEQADGGGRWQIEGDIFGEHRVTRERADVKKLLAPVAQVALL